MTVNVSTALNVSIRVRCSNASFLGISNVKIEIDGIDETLSTDENGRASIKLNEGVYKFHLNGFGYKQDISQSNTFSVVNYDKEIELMVVYDITEEIKPAFNGDIQLLVSGMNNNSCTLDINSEDSAYIIDWGDGSSSEATGSGAISYSHIYSGGGAIYCVSIKKCENITFANISYVWNNTGGYLLAYWSVGNSKVHNLSFGKNDIGRYLRYVGPDVLKNDTDRKDFTRCFYNCFNLKFFDVRMSHLTSANNFTEFLYNCHGIETNLPELWKMYASSDVITENCFYNCKNALNWEDIPYTWGGPKVVKTITLSIFKDNAWYLNQRVKVRDSLLTQNADGAYSILFTGLENTYLDISVNDEVVGCIEYKGLENVNSFILLGDCSSIATIYDYTKGDTHDDIIESNSSKYPWVFSEELGGFRSGRIFNQENWSDLTLRLPEAKYCIILGYSIPETIWENISVYVDTIFKWKNIGGITKDDILMGSFPVTEKIKFSFYKYKSDTPNYKDCAWIKKIYTLTNPPALPENFTPIPAALLAMNGSVIADYKAVNYRLARIETALGFND